VLKNIRELDLGPPHPGEILREDMMPRLHLATKGLADKLHLSNEAVADLLAERTAVTAEIASHLAANFGHSVRFWLGLQMQYDRWAARTASQPV
jgi:antitoxin HigA-1